ncbi:MAG: winged helix-turn-helix transcriptional regulator [Nitrososphaerota archaeon]|jgi:predicted transcriptional regulator|nr:winged helix-turn-helix domain-containing protein [Nitrososphaerota archaeon]MDG6909668.1 winged helix-turn-helix transcriptional regulator [Nitrososphaerota archaeon]MDG6937528.1 winged helix-turn-helix transcriptional regulator [Nitrososphaerota archaeon]MDG6961670.1 winged helix-turn-helix transcriptional regulator [Nitrososphaerota archaeon]MDG7018052.1 winged helix-turn-helix transcriptional regulator [Nitrososphaerota archaeon]
MESKTQAFDEAVLKILRRGPATPDEVAKELKVAWATAQGRLMKLVADGTLVSVRKGKVNVYFLKYPAEVVPRRYPWAKARDLRELAGELESYFPSDMTAAEMVEREQRRS